MRLNREDIVTEYPSVFFQTKYNTNLLKIEKRETVSATCSSNLEDNASHTCPESHFCFRQHFVKHNNLTQLRGILQVYLLCNVGTVGRYLGLRD